MLEAERTAFTQERTCVLGPFAKKIRAKFPTIEALKGAPFRCHLLALCWILVTNIVRLECGHASNRRAMYSGGRQGKAPRFSRISSMQFFRHLRCRFEEWCRRLALRLSPWEPQEVPKQKKRNRGSFAFKIFMSERPFPSGNTGYQVNDEEVRLVRAASFSFLVQSQVFA